MKNYVEPGEVLPWTAPAGGVVSGGIYKIGDLIIVATVDAPAGEKFSAYIGPGVVEADKATGTAWAEGVKVYWDAAAKKFTTTVGTNTLAGVAAFAAASGDTKGSVRLDGVAR